jgi:hypothetical protein
MLIQALCLCVLFSVFLVLVVVVRLLVCRRVLVLFLAFISFGLALSVCFCWYFLYHVFNKSLPY